MKLKIIISMISATLLFILILEVANAGKFIYGLKIAGINVSGIDLIKAESLLSQKNNQINQEYFILKYQNKTLKITPKNLGISIDIQKTLENAYQTGRKSNFLINFLNKTKILFTKKNIDLVIAVNQEKMETALAEFKNSENFSQNSEIKYDQGRYIATISRPGKIFDREIIIQNAIDGISNFKTATIELNLKDIKPEITETKLETLVDFLNRVIEGAPYDLVLEDIKIPLDKDLINQWIMLKKEQINNEINITMSFDDAKIHDYLFSLIPAVSRPSRNAELAFENNKIKIKAPSSDATELLLPETQDNIKHNLMTTQQKNIEIYVKRKPAKINEKNLDELGIKTQLSVGNSNFSGSHQARIDNIRVGAAKFDDYIIKPNEEFSFAKILGAIGPEQGYQPELVIKSGKTVKEYGGGLCQVSTTMFRAAVKAGLPITERQPHAYPVKYYAPQGFDSTIYPPHPDLRFINNTDNNILIQLKIEKYDIYFEFYGTSDNRKVEIIGPITLKSNSDGSMTTKLTQQVFKENKMVSERIFNSFYKSPALYPVIKNPLE